MRSGFTEVKWLSWTLAMHHNKEMTEILVLNKSPWKLFSLQKEREINLVVFKTQTKLDNVSLYSIYNLHQTSQRFQPC